LEVFLITIKASDARRREATTEAYEAIRRKEERALARLWWEGNAADDALMVNRGGGWNLAIRRGLCYQFPRFARERVIAIHPF